MAVRAMKAGASDFIEKPIRCGELLASIDRALDQSRRASQQLQWREAATNHVASLTPRQRQIMTLVLAGQPGKTCHRIVTRRRPTDSSTPSPSHRKGGAA